MLGTLFLLLALLVLAGALFARARTGRAVRGQDPVGSGDPVLDEILAGGGGTWEEDDDPLDEDRIREEEDRFWEREWDEPDEWPG
jgi:hypothetical protein